LKALPLIIGFGGINAAGRSSFHHGYMRMVYDSLPAAKKAECLQSLAVLMQNGENKNLRDQDILDGTLIRTIQPSYFDITRAHTQKKVRLSGSTQPLQFVISKKDLPVSPPADWTIKPLSEQELLVSCGESATFFVDEYQPYPVGAAGQIPTGFDPGATYSSRNHPKGLQLAIYAASDAIRSTGLDWNHIQSLLPPEQISVYASSAMGQLDDYGSGGMLRSGLMGKRVSSKQCPMGFADMPADFINAYVLGNVGTTGSMVAACASLLYNMKLAVQDIQSGRAQLCIVGGGEAPILQDVMEGYRSMSALADDEGLKRLDGSDTPDHRRACRPFSDNCGFTIAESGQFFILCSDQLALKLGAHIYGAVPSVFVNADGIKRSISAPGVGNYLTVGRALNNLQQALENHGGLERSFTMAHGTGTPQNRVTESHILDGLAGEFKIQEWPTAAIKCFVGHSIGAASGDQIAAALGVFEQNILPGITTVDHFADDVYRDHLFMSSEHTVYEQGHFHGALINSKGFGGNNASAAMLSGDWCRQYLQNKHSADDWKQYQNQLEQTHIQQLTYKDQLLTEIPQSIYRFGEPAVAGYDLKLSDQKIELPGYQQPVSLETEFPY
jgi:acetoacetyl-[acyl-carrier protein] synthase